jgi:hypothetical protein
MKKGRDGGFSVGEIRTTRPPASAAGGGVKSNAGSGGASDILPPYDAYRGQKATGVNCNSTLVINTFPNADDLAVTAQSKSYVLI